VEREFIIDANSAGVAIALLEDKALVELQREKSNKKYSVGDVYLGKVRKIMPVKEMLNLDAEYIARQEASKSFDKEERVEVYIQSIKEDPEWLEVVIKKAAEQGKSIEEMIREDAIFMVDQELKK
jgi:Ribonuclease G/E